MSLNSNIGNFFERPTPMKVSSNDRQSFLHNQIFTNNQGAFQQNQFRGINGLTALTDRKAIFKPVPSTRKSGNLGEYASFNLNAFGKSFSVKSDNEGQEYGMQN